jgi:putative endonuclease
MYYVYILLSLKDGKFYIGFSEDIQKRLADHNAGRNTSTKPRRPLKLIYYEAHLSKEDALRRESYFKTIKGKSTLRRILRDSLSIQIKNIESL